ncbi:MAG: hypothetical protein JNM43_23425, partial [Planctomycetaceae bacterium]|nr:hypothetical protein [Planctomycetaceae bacterium]
MGLLSKLFGNSDEPDFPPVPKWEPSIVIPQDRIIERFVYYTDGTEDFVVFTHGTCVIVDAGQTDDQAISQARQVLHAIFHFHPDMNPAPMDDGNILVRYNHPAFNVVLDDIVIANWQTLKANHQKALCTDEVLITPLGPNKFDDFGIKALFGRCYFFMDARNPKA